MISVTALQQNSKTIYVGLLSTLTVFFVDGLYSGIGFIFPVGHSPRIFISGVDICISLRTGYPKFNKKVSKYLLQYSVVGLGFGMNLQASLASGKEGMEFTIISVIGYNDYRYVYRA